MLKRAESQEGVPASTEEVPRDEIIRKPDGGTVYLTRDLAAIFYRAKMLHADKIIYVIGKEQANHCLELFNIASQLGHMSLGNAVHVSFGHINVAGRKMKSREGKVVLLNDLLDESINAAQHMLRLHKAEGRGIDIEDDTNDEYVRALELSEEEEEAARMIGTGALIFDDLKQDRMKDIEFNPDLAGSIQEGAATYVQYTHARFTRLLGHDQEELPPLTTIPDSLHPTEQELVFQLSQLPLVVAEAADENAPHKLAVYLSALCHTANNFYAECPIMRKGVAVAPVERTFRLQLAAATRQVIRNSANLLHLELPDRMGDARQEAV
jgi:arginyl-tRNA synthetase